MEKSIFTYEFRLFVHNQYFAIWISHGEFTMLVMENPHSPASQRSGDGSVAHSVGEIDEYGVPEISVGVYVFDDGNK